jgi:hypothetical protein
MTMSPHCQALRWVIYNGGYTINMMWFILGNWLLSKLKFEPEAHHHVFGEKKNTTRKHRSRLVPDIVEEDTSSEETSDEDDDEDEDDRT